MSTFKSRTKFMVQEAIKVNESEYSSTKIIDELPLLPTIKYETSLYFLSEFGNADEKAVALRRISEFCSSTLKMSNEESARTGLSAPKKYNDEYIWSPCDDSDIDKDYEPSSSGSESEEENLTRKKKSIRDRDSQAIKKIRLSESEDHNREESAQNELSEEPSRDHINPLVTTDRNVTIVNVDNQKKKRVNRTENEKIENHKAKHPQKDKCLGKCRRDCVKLSEADRIRIWDSYWNMNYTNRRKWLSKHVSLIPVKCRILSAPKHRSESRLFSLPCSDSTEIKVCRLTFLNTLGYTNDSVITELVRAMKRKPCGAMVKETRGIHKKSIDTTLIINHIESFHPYVSHYRRKNAPNRKYLPRDLTIHMMYSDFNEKHPSICKIETYRKILRDMNISMTPPKSDLCDECETLKDNDSEEIIGKLNVHKQKAAKANVQYKKDAEEAAAAGNSDKSKGIYSMDLQKVMLLPIMPQCKSSFFISRLVVFNETFATLNRNTNRKSYCVLWHEALAGRKAEAIVDSILKVISAERDVTEFLFWADNCTAQNKNWVLFSSLINLVNQVTGPNKITIRYLTKGHTHMSADGVHGNIEKKIGRRRTICDYQELTEVIKSSRKNLDVLQLTEFNSWQNKKRASKKLNDILKGFRIRDLVEVIFMKGSRNLRYKLDFDDEEIELDFLQKKVTLPFFSEALRSRGISTSKKEQIVKELVPLMPLNRRIFWESLPESQASMDLLSSEQNIDSDDE